MAERTLVSRSGQVPGDNGGMLAIVLALAAAIVYGGSDFTAGLATRGASVIQVTLIASVMAAAVAMAAVPFAATGHRPAAAALAWGVLAGVAARPAPSRCTSGSGTRRSAWPGRSARWAPRDFPYSRA
jgi:hypothetical protein